MAQATLVISGGPQRLFPAVRTSRDLLDYTLFLPGIWLCCALSIALRMIGPGFVVIPTGCCIIYALLRRVVPPRWLSAFVAYCLFIGVLSYWHLLPTSWQVYFIPELIIRQLIPLIGFFAVAWASKAYFRLRIARGDVFSGGIAFVLLGTFVAPLVLYQQGFGYQDDYSFLAVLALTGAFLNNVHIAAFYLMGALFLTKDLRYRISLGLILLIGATTHFVQFKIFTAMILATRFGMPGRTLAIWLVVMLVGIYGVGLNYVADAMQQDPNDGLRLALVSDALTSALDTNGIGVGYGKELVRWVYRFPGMPNFTFLPDPKTMSRDRMLEALSRGVENSFAMALLRTGVVGFVLLVASMCAAFPPRNLPRDIRNHAAAMYAMMFITCFVNPALETPTQAVGVGFMYGYLIALRAAAPKRCPQIDTASLQTEN